MIPETMCIYKCEGTSKNCKLTTYKRCPKECSFYRTAKQLAESERKARELLVSLPEEKRQWISDKYYEGKRPWEE